MVGSGDNLGDPYDMVAVYRGARLFYIFVHNDTIQVHCWHSDQRDINIRYDIQDPNCDPNRICKYLMEKLDES